MRENIEDNIEEIITDISELDNINNFTVARVMENGKCVELHYDEGNATLEFDLKDEENVWNNQYVTDAEWFNLNLTNDEILEHLDKEFDNFFMEKEEELDFDY